MTVERQIGPPGFSWERSGDDFMITDESGDRHLAGYHEHILILQVMALREALEAELGVSNCQHDYISLIGGIRCVKCGLQIAVRQVAP